MKRSASSDPASRAQKIARLADDNTSRTPTTVPQLQWHHIRIYQDFQLKKLNESCQRYNRLLPFARKVYTDNARQTVEFLEAMEKSKVVIAKAKRKLKYMSDDLFRKASQFAKRTMEIPRAYEAGDLFWKLVTAIS